MTIVEDTGPRAELEWREMGPVRIEWDYKSARVPEPKPVRPCRQSTRRAARKAAKAAKRGSIPK